MGNHPGHQSNKHDEFFYLEGKPPSIGNHRTPNREQESKGPKCGNIIWHDARIDCHMHL
jgi:hypothetical protein